jgi:tetratricopeptide (TPR) repeat protein
VARSGLEDINAHFASVGQQVEKEPVPALLGQIEAKDGADLTKAIYEINAPVQLRMVPNIFRSVGKEFPEALKKLAPPESENNSYEILRELLEGDLLQAERMARDHAFKNPGDYMPRILHGFIAVEKGDLEKAEQVFKDAEPLGPAPFHHTYMFYLRGRVFEIQYKFDSAIGMYKQAAIHSPKWKEPTYRQAVCMVKMGFTEHALDIFSQLFKADPSYFNRIIIDPELERGAVQILSHLWDPWTDAQSAAQDGMNKLAQFSKDLEEWFGEESGEFGKQIKKSADNLREMGEVENYVAFRRIVSGYAKLSKEMRRQVDEEIKVLNKKAQIFSDQLKDIHEEISWFPFPKALREFNKDFNYCASRVNWVKTQHFRVAENFRKSRLYFDEVEEKIKKLQSHLVTLRLVRDATLFMLLLGKSFMWYEIVGLGLSLVLGPVIIYLAEAYGSAWAKELLVDQRWALQKGLIIVLSVLALTAAFVRNSMAFEKKKGKFFVKYKDKEPERMAKRAKKMKARREKRVKQAQAARAKAAKKAK